MTLRTLRERDGLSQEQLAIAVGISRTYISDMERGGGNPSYDMLIRLAAVFGMPASELLAESERNQQLLEECKDTHITDIDVDERVLLVTLSGTAECSACIQTWRQVLKIAQEKHVNGILMNALAVNGSVSMRDHKLIATEVAAQMADRKMDLKRAMVGKPPTVIRVGAAEAEPVKAAVFSTVEEALHWLKSP